MIEKSETEPSLADMIQRWLERTPGLETDGFNFWEKYENAVESLLDEQRVIIKVSDEYILHVNYKYLRIK